LFPVFVTPRFRASRAALSLSVALALLAGGAAGLRGQSALDGFDPNANGDIRVIVVQPDGKILIGGLFTTLAPNGGPTVTRNYIARLNPDGTLDTAFNPNATAAVMSIAIQADGKVLVGGAFSGANSIGGQARNRMARLDATTGLADSFNPNANDYVLSIVIQADGKILVGGAFTNIGGQTRRAIARLDAMTGSADSFDPSASDSVSSIAVQGDGKILVGGNFFGASSIGGQTRNFIARLNAATGLADSFDPNASGAVSAVAVQANGKILACGQFLNIGGQTRNRIARLNDATGLADSFNPSADGWVNSIALQADGKILAGGEFANMGGQPRNHLARLDATSGLADSFDPSARCAAGQCTSLVVWSIAVQADGKILAAGDFDRLAPNGGSTKTRNHIARLEADGRLDQTLNLNAVGQSVYTTAIQRDGKILIGGRFSSVLGVMRNNIARLNGDGTLDTAFNPNANGDVNAIAVQVDGKIVVGGSFSNIGGQIRNYIGRVDAGTGLADSFDPVGEGNVYSIVVQADGKILVGGEFTVINGQTRNYMARLDPATGSPDSFNPNAGNRVYAIAVQADGKILVGGWFTSIGGQTRTHIARLDLTTGMADSFNPDANFGGYVFCIAVQPDGKVIVGGGFFSIGGQTRFGMARLDPANGLADSFNPHVSDTVVSIAVQGDGKIVVGGNFFGANSIGGQTRNYIARLDPATGQADSFDPNASAIVWSIALQADGKVLAGGDFSGANSIGGQPRDYFARLSNGTAALQNLAVTQNIITWTRGGSSPQFARVTFEYSTDNLNFTSLGNGTAVSSSWSLSALSLPSDQNFYVRARGFYRSGYANSSGSITESVRYAFLKPLRISAVTRSSNDFVVTFDAVIGSTYRLERKLSLADANWQSIAGVSDQTATATVAQFTDPNALSLGKAFYRVRLLP
jgi:uncharacterized delta-60 repeat protein